MTHVPYQGAPTLQVWSLRPSLRKLCPAHVVLLRVHVAARGVLFVVDIKKKENTLGWTILPWHVLK